LIFANCYWVVQSLSGAAMLYQRLLKPSIVRRCLKAR
jgi:hypothetical protein